MLTKSVERHLKSKWGWPGLLAVSVLLALVIALAMIGILGLFDFTINPAIPVAVGVLAAAAFIARARR